MARMKHLNRREVCAGLSAAAVIGMTGAGMSEAQATSVVAGNGLAQSRVFRFAETPASMMPNGAERREMTKGTLATGEAISLHESVQPAGLPPNPAHVVQHSEFIAVLAGTLEYKHDGKTELATAGDVIYVAVGTNHAVRNAGDVPAKYVVLQISGDTK
jgi:mannose-6-phosphate isomerase-like protein (cupin superfamily)